MNVFCQIIFCFISLTYYEDEKNSALILEQLINQLAINREAIQVDRHELNKMLYRFNQVTADLKELQLKVVDLENSIKEKHQTEEESLILLAEKVSSKLSRYLLRELKSVKTLALVSIFADKNNNKNNKFKELLEDRVRRKLAVNKSLNFLNIDSEEKIQRSWSNSQDKDIVFKSLNSEAEILVLLIIEDDIEDCYLDVFFKQSQNIVVVPPVQKLKQTPAQGPALAPAPARTPAPAQAPTNFRFFKR